MDQPPDQLPEGFRRFYAPKMALPWDAITMSNGQAARGPGFGFVVLYPSLEALHQDWPGIDYFTIDAYAAQEVKGESA